MENQKYRVHTGALNSSSSHWQLLFFLIHSERCTTEWLATFPGKCVFLGNELSSWECIIFLEKHRVSPTDIWAATSKLYLSCPLPQFLAILCLLVIFGWSLSDVLHLFLFTLNLFSHCFLFFVERGAYTQKNQYALAWKFQARPLDRLCTHFKSHHGAGLAPETHEVTTRGIADGISISDR